MELLSDRGRSVSVLHLVEICDAPVAVAEGEQAINETVYHLYGLTADEVAIVEGKL